MCPAREQADLRCTPSFQAAWSDALNPLNPNVSDLGHLLSVGTFIILRRILGDLGGKTPVSP